MAVQNEFLALYLNEDNTRLAIVNKQDGHVWKSWIDPDELSKKPNKKWTTNINALVLLKYAEVGNLTGDVGSDNNAGLKCEITRTVQEQGVTLRFDFSKINIAFDLVLTLDGPSMHLLIPDATIKEGETHVIMAISPLPYLGYTQDSTDGYYLYPNGSGELYVFKDEELRKAAVREYTMEAYAESHVELWKMCCSDNWVIYDPTVEVLIPAWGVRAEGSAFSALVEAGDVNASITVLPSGSSIKANRIYSSFTFRKSFGTFGSAISIGGGTGVNLLGILNDKERIRADRAIHYTFLSGDEANYSGMACAVRQRLIETGKLTGTTDADMPLVLDLLCGVMEQKMMLNQLIPMTTFDQAGTMVAELGAQGVEHMLVNLKGWGAKGVMGSPANLPAASALGGEKALRRLAAQCRENHAELFLTAELVDIWSGNGGYSLNADTARDINQYIYEMPDGDQTHYLAAPASSAKWNTRLIDKVASYGVSGICYDRVGDLVFDDYSKGHVALAAQAAQTYNAMAEESARKLGAAAVNGGNLYMLSQAKLVNDVPENGDYMLLSDMSVPFVQMVLHGSVVYTGKEINGLYDPAMQQLKMIEYGYAPYYELTWQNPNLIRNTDYNELYSSEFSAWREHAAASYQFFQGALGGVWNQYIVRHEQADTDVVAVTYADGTVIYLNYGAETWQRGDVRVESSGYAVVKEGAR